MDDDTKVICDADAVRRIMEVVSQGGAKATAIAERTGLKRGRVSLILCRARSFGLVTSRETPCQTCGRSGGKLWELKS